MAIQDLSLAEYEAMRTDAVVTAADHHGDKVLLLADGTYLKLFRVKRLLTSARLFPYWRRFQKNALRLTELGIPTLDVISVFRIAELDRTAVHYHPLPGVTLRELGGLDERRVAQFGEFIRRVHDKGVYLRSMHLGNVVLTPGDEMGLIDIADMRILRRSLSRRLRFRNFHHLCRYVDDRAEIALHIDTFLGGFPEEDQPRLRQMFEADSQD